MQQGLRSLCCLSFFFSTEAQRRPYYADYSPARKYIHTLCTSHYLDLFITFIIGVNVITMSMEHYNQPKVRATHQCVGCETQQCGVAADLRTTHCSLGIPLTSEVSRQPCFPGTIPWCLKASAGSRLSIAICLTLGQLCHLGVTCPSQKFDFPALA